MQFRYGRSAARALSIQPESVDNWLYLAARSKGVFRPASIRRQNRQRWRPTMLARVFGAPACSNSIELA